MALAPFVSPQTIAIIVGVLCLLKLYSYCKKSKLELHYAKDNALFKEFVEKSKITTMEFEHYLFAPHIAMQSMCLVLKQVVEAKIWPEKFDLEIFKLKDGATVGLCWDGERPDPSIHPDKPILCILPGIQGPNKINSNHMMREFR